VQLDPRVCYRALRARDRRFDGAFFVAVKTTGIYCRPICPARVPRADRCMFVRHAAEAERHGYRACFRCRPELAPGLARVDATSRLVSRAVSAIEGGCLETSSLEGLATELGVSSRHLRRAMEAEIGVTPVEFAQTKRLALAKQLLHDTRLSLSDVAFASGFKSIRRFNSLFRERFGRPPSAVRKTLEARREDATDDEPVIALRLEYRPPLAWPSLLGFLRARAIAGLETVTEDEYARSVRIGDDAGWVRVRHARGDKPALLARVSMSLRARLTTVAARLRMMFDLDAQPHAIAEYLSADRHLAKLVAREPGLRLPGAFDPFESSVRAVLGQQVSVKGATTLAGRLVERFGRFPSAEELSDAKPNRVQAIGLPSARAETLVRLARAVASGTVDLGGDPSVTIAALEQLPGIGAWTAQYIAMRAMHWPDAFPAGDLGLKKALGTTDVSRIEARATGWRPWRAYAVMHLWRSL
jgi:AraC family transcriptional regulator of adaptative response / DNA-3-methyladenine glycosylase II